MKHCTIVGNFGKFGKFSKYYNYYRSCTNDLAALKLSYLLALLWLPRQQFLLGHMTCLVVMQNGNETP